MQNKNAAQEVGRALKTNQKKKDTCLVEECCDYERLLQATRVLCYFEFRHLKNVAPAFSE